MDNAVITCDGSCLYTEWELNNVGYQKFDCIGDVTNPWAATDSEACNDIEINGQEASQLEMVCVNEHSCNHMTICTDNTLNLYCQGSKACRHLHLCHDTEDSNKTNIILPTPAPTQPSYAPTTAEPTDNPTTAEPTTTRPTFAPTAPTFSPTTAEPTEKPTKEPTIETHSSEGNRIFAWFWMVLVIASMDFLQIM